MALIGEMQYLTIGGNTYSIPTSGGSTVTIERALTSGTKSATISVDGTSYDLYAPTPNAGTVTSVRVQATSPVQSSTSTAQSSTLNTTISLANGYGDTKNPYGTKTANYVLAGPTTGSAAAPSFRALVAADIPDLSGTYLTSHLTGSGAIDVENEQIKLNIRSAFSGGTDEQVIFIAKGSTSGISGLYIGLDDGSIDGEYLFIPDSNGVSTASQQIINSIPTKVSQLTNDSGYITSADVPEGASAYTGTISAVGTSASTGTNNGFARGDHVHNITKTTVDSVLGTGSGTTKFYREDGTWATPAYTTNTDTKLQVAAVNSGTVYYPIVGTGTTAATRQFDTTGFSYQGTNGTTSAIGCGKITLGNSTASGTTNNKQGQLVMYGSTAYAHTIKGAPTKARTLTLPDADGTFALTSQIPTVPTSTESATTGITASTTATKTTLGTASSIYGVGSTTTTASKASGGNGTAPSWAFEEISIPNVTAAGSASTWTFGATTVGDGTLVGAVDSSDSSMLVITAGTKSVQQKTGGGNGTAPTIGTAIKVQSKKSGSNGSASTWSFTDVTVPIKDSSATSVPNVSVASATVSITDPGHTHTI